MNCSFANILPNIFANISLHIDQCKYITKTSLNASLNISECNFFVHGFQHCRNFLDQKALLVHSNGTETQCAGHVNTWCEC